MTINTQVFKNIRKIQIRTGRLVHDLLAGSYHSAFKGRGMEFEDVRAYQIGDEIRSIDWNVTARMQFPYIKNYKEERELTVTLIVDISSSSYFGTIGKQKNEIIAEIAALLAFSAIKNNDKVGLILFTDEIERYIPPGKGTKHVLRVIRELLIYMPKRKKTNIAKALSYFVKIQKRKGVAFLISDFFSPPFSKELSITARKHDLIAIKLSDPKETLFPRMGLVSLHDLETNEVVTIDTHHNKTLSLFKNFKKHSEKVKKSFEKTGSGLIDITLGQSYAQAIHKFFNKRKC